MKKIQLKAILVIVLLVNSLVSRHHTNIHKCLKSHKTTSLSRRNSNLSQIAENALDFAIGFADSFIISIANHNGRQCFENGDLDFYVSSFEEYFVSETGLGKLQSRFRKHIDPRDLWSKEELELLNLNTVDDIALIAGSTTIKVIEADMPFKSCINKLKVHSYIIGYKIYSKNSTIMIYIRHEDEKVSMEIMAILSILIM